MSTQTTNYNLIKPQATDPIDLLMTNSNWDVIDEKLKEASESGGATVVVQSEPPADTNAIWIDPNDETVTEVPLVKVAVHPTFVESIDEMTDTSKVYVMPDGYLYAYIKNYRVRNFTADDFTVTQVEPTGNLINGDTRIATTELIPLADGAISIQCPEPYQYFVYYYTDNYISAYIGKTAWKSGSIDDVLNDTINSGTVNGATYCRISLRDGSNDSASLTGRVDEFMSNIIISQKKDVSGYSFQNTGVAYNQFPDHEFRITELENKGGSYTLTEADKAEIAGTVVQNNAKIYYSALTNGIYVNSHYSEDNDISFYLCKKGPNSIFDFSTVGLVAKAIPVSTVTTPTKYLVSSSGDWHAPYVVRAVNNANGDNISSGYFTGGNHSYTNTASGVATGRTADLKMYADGKVLANGNKGYCNSIKLEWDNYVQGYNTTKADGSGREILREHITMMFDGEKWETETTIYPLEEITIQTWYGLQFFTSAYSYVAYIGGETGVITAKAEDSEAGNAEANAMKFFNLTDTAIVEIDTAFDLGRRKYAANTTKSFFAKGSYSKGYGTIIGAATSLPTAGAFSMRGSYLFKHEIQQEPATPAAVSILNLNRTESANSNSYLGTNREELYINPAKSNAVTVSGTPCTVSNLTESSITVKESGAGSTGCAFPIKIGSDSGRRGKTFLFTWNATGTTNTRMFLTCFGNSNAKYIQIDKSGTKSSCTIEISADGNTITVDGAANASNGNPFETMCFFFGSATNTTTSYTGVSLVEVE